jgi:hypothetical protein
MRKVLATVWLAFVSAIAVSAQTVKPLTRLDATGEVYEPVARFQR